MITPCPGLTLRRTREGIPVVRVHYTADPDLTSERIAELRRRYVSQAHWDKEMEVKYEALGGALVYPEFSREHHVVDPGRIPRRLCRYMAIDPHPRTPTAALWVGLDRFEDIYVTRELWPSRLYGDMRQTTDQEEENVYPLKWYAEAYAALEGNYLEWHNGETEHEYAIYRRKPDGERIIYRLMDQAGKGFQATAEGVRMETFATRFARFGIQCSDPRKAHQAGEDAVHDALKLRASTLHDKPWPRLHISADCEELIGELENHRYRITRIPTEERDLRQERAEYRCHMADCLRYLANSPLRYSEGYES